METGSRRWRDALLTPSASADAWRLLAARSLRGLGDGFVSVLLASYLDGLGFSPIEVGAIVTSTLAGSAVLTLAVGLVSHRVALRRVLFGAAVLMFLTGMGFAGITSFWPLLVVAFAGTMNPSGGDVSVFLPVEQSLLSEKVHGRDRTALFARYNLGGTFAAAIGALCAGIPAIASRAYGWDNDAVDRAGFAAYAVLAIFIGWLYTGLRDDRKTQVDVGPLPGPLRKSRGIVLRLSALFSLDSFGGGFVVQSLLVLWLFERFDLSVGAAGTIFFAAGLLSAWSQLVSSWLAARIGLVETMVFTHLPANAFLILAALMPSAPLAIGFLRVSLCRRWMFPRGSHT